LFYPKKIPVFILSVFAFITAFSQRPQFSLGTDLSILRSFKKEQRFFSVGQTVYFHFHFTPTDGAYAWFTYYANGKFTNDVTAIAKSPVTAPQQINYLNHVQMRLKQISLGWRHYLKGTFDSETNWNLYGLAGFGIMMGSVTNNQSAVIDSNVYRIPVLGGQAQFKRLTFDLGLGVEFPVGGDLFLYFEGRALIPTTDYPSQYLFINKNAPFTATVNAGLRILFY
jgi:hypothetical protein